MMTATADTPDADSATTNAASIVTLGLDGSSWDRLLIWALALAALVAGAVVVATTGSIITHKRETEAAEADLARYKVYAGQRISANETLTATANERAAALESRAAETRERAAKLEVQLQAVREQADQTEKNVAYRIIDHGRFLSELGAKTKGRVQLQYVVGAETLAFTRQLAMFLREAGWETLGPTMIDQTLMGSGFMIPLVLGGTGTNPPNVMPPREYGNVEIIGRDFDGLAKVLSDALEASGVRASRLGDPRFVTDDIVVRVGPRLH